MRYIPVTLKVVSELKNVIISSHAVERKDPKPPQIQQILPSWEFTQAVKFGKYRVREGWVPTFVVRDQESLGSES